MKRLCLAIAALTALMLGVRLLAPAPEHQAERPILSRAASNPAPTPPTVVAFHPATTPPLDQGRGAAPVAPAPEPDVSSEPVQEEPALEFESLALEAIPEKLAALTANGTEAALEAKARLLRHWAEGYPPQAAEWVSRLGKEDGYQAMAEQVGLGWAVTDPAGALQWAGALPDTEENRGAKLAVAYETAPADPMQAIELARVLSASPDRDELLVFASRQWAAENPDAAAEWAGQMEEGALRSRLLAAIATSASEANPAGAADLIAKGLGAGEEQNAAAVAVVQRWAQTQPEQAASWVRQFPADETGVAAVQNLVDLWAMKDPAAARSWAESLAEGPLRQAALNAIPAEK